MFGGETVSSGPPEPRVSYDGNSAPTSSGAVLSALDPETGLIWSCTHDIHVGFQTSVEVYVTDDEAQALQTHIVTPTTHCFVNDIIYVAGTLEMWVITNTSGAHHFAIIYNASASTYVETVDLGYYGTANNSQAVYNPLDNRVVIFSASGLFYTVNPAARTVDTAYDLVTTPVDFYTGRILDAGDYFAAFPYNGAYHMELVRKTDYTTYATLDDPGNGAISAYDPERNRIIVRDLGGPMGFNVIDVDTMTMTNYPLGVGPDPDADYSTSLVSVVYCAYNDRYIFGANASPNPKKTTLHIVNPDTLATESTYTYEDYDGTARMLPYLLTPLGDPNYILSFDTTSIKRLYLGELDRRRSGHAREHRQGDFYRRAGRARGRRHRRERARGRPGRRLLRHAADAAGRRDHAAHERVVLRRARLGTYP